jgi:hypothetical protein
LPSRKVKFHVCRNPNQRNTLNNDHFSRTGQGSEAQWRKHPPERQLTRVKRLRWIAVDLRLGSDGVWRTGSFTAPGEFRVNSGHIGTAGKRRAKIFLAATKEFLG